MLRIGHKASLPWQGSVSVRPVLKLKVKSLQHLAVTAGTGYQERHLLVAHNHIIGCRSFSSILCSNYKNPNCSHLQENYFSFQYSSLYRSVCICCDWGITRFIHSRHLSDGTINFQEDNTFDTGQTLPEKSKIVICGGGVIGSSVAYHLALMGWRDVVLLEQGSLTCGTTWHAAGLVGMLRGTAAESAICSYSVKLYKELEQEGYATGWKTCGGLYLSRTNDRKTYYTRSLLNARRLGVKSEFLSPGEIKERYPFLHTDDLEGGLLIPDEGVANGPDVALALARKAKENGVEIIEKCRVLSVVTEKNKVVSITTDRGDIACQYFVNCAGQWGHDLGQMSNTPVRVPLHSCEHFYLITKPIGMDSMMPAIRDYDGYVYAREWSGGLLGGGFEPVGKPVFHDGIPEKFEYQLLPEDWDHFQILLEQLLHRIPALAEAEVRQLTNGPESFTPDGKYILGRTPEVENYYVAAGMNSSGIAAAGGVGKAMAEWIINGEPSMNLWSMDVRRFVDLHNNKKFLKSRVTETLGMTERVRYWETDMVQHTLGRKVRTSPMYARVEGDAKFGQSMGYERPLYFLTSGQDQDGLFPRRSRESASYEFSETEVPKTGTFGKPQWLDHVRAEYWACREGVCLIDMSTFSKFELRGGDEEDGDAACDCIIVICCSWEDNSRDHTISAGQEVVDFLQYVCSNNIDRPIGSLVHTGMQNHQGGYENDCSVVRLDNNRYFMISPTAQQTRSIAWLREHLPKDGSVQMSDVTSMYTALNVLGPKAQELLSELTDTPLSKQEFIHMTCKEINVGQASGIIAMRLTHSGEDGWMLYIPSEYALHVYDSLMTAGKNYGIQNAGYYALRALRTEKFFAYWGTDLTPQVTPLECGREYRVKFDKGGFIGYPALLKQRNEGIKKRLVQLLLEDHDLEEDSWPWGGEPIYRNGMYCGITTSTAYGFTVDRHVLLGYVHNYDDVTGNAGYVTNDFILKNANFEIDIAGKRFPAKAGIYPPKLASAEIII